LPYIAALFAFVLTGTSELVVCFGQNGHVALEFQKQSCCESTQQTYESSSSNVSFTQNVPTDCGSCFDVPIFTGDKTALPNNNINKTLSKATVAKASITTASFIPLAFNHGPPKASFYFEQAPKHPSYTTLTVVLLI
jgi:hypothetical protein